MGSAIFEPGAQELQVALDEVLAGSSFRSSAQCQALLRYIVEHSIAHQDEMLRERLIGVHVFGRAPDYDTGNDPVVRSRAAEVRKRLAQHYINGAQRPGSLRIQIPSGSYRALFKVEPDVERITSEDFLPVVVSPVQQENEPLELALNLAHEGPNQISATQEQDHPTLKEKRVRFTATVSISLLGLLLVSLVAGLFIRHSLTAAANQPFRTFWAPVLTEHPTLISLGGNHTYIFSKEFLHRYSQEHHLDEQSQGGEFFIDLKKGTVIDEGDLIAVKTLIGPGDVAAATRIASLVTSFGKSYDLRYADNLTISDLKSTPAIIIGGFSNSWTLELMHQLPFRLTDGSKIIDSSDKQRSWSRSREPGTVRGDDYSIVTRLVGSETGNFILDIAGIDTSSNQAAAEFISNPDKLNGFLRTLPKGWESHNLQIVIHTTVVADVPAVFNIEAVKTW